MVKHRRDRRRLLHGCAVIFLFGVTGCQELPRNVPLAAELDRSSSGDGASGLVLPLTAAIAAAVNRPPPRAFPAAFRDATEINPEALGVDDELELLIWEPGGATLFAGPVSEPRTSASSIAAVRVDGQGTIFLPFVGSVRAAGLTAAQLRRRLHEALGQLADAPEVDVRVTAARSRIVTVQGAVNKPGAYMVDRGFTRLTPILALAGGSPLPPEQVEVVVRRGDAIGAEMLEDIYADPALNVSLRPGDTIVLNPIRERFVILGASSAQGEITFPTRTLTLLSAIGAASGLRDFDADPQGVFVMRFEDPAVVEHLLPTPTPSGLPQGYGRPVIYRLDMSGPEGLFAAQTFLMRDGDAIFASNAPLTEVRKLLQIFTSVLTPVQQAAVVSSP